MQDMWEYGKYLSCDRCPYEDTNECLKCIKYIEYKDKGMESDCKKIDEREENI